MDRGFWVCPDCGELAPMQVHRSADAQRVAMERLCLRFLEGMEALRVMWCESCRAVIVVQRVLRADPEQWETLRPYQGEKGR